jgi:CRISPR-associated protein Csd1
VSWIQKLYETYELCANAPQFEKEPLLPVSHTEQQAHIEIVLDQSGEFQRAALVAKETTIVPATEASAGRTGKKAPPHPLCDKIQYCAGDYSVFGGTKEPMFDQFIQQLRRWYEYDPNPKIGAILSYVAKKSVVADLVRAGVLLCGPDRVLLTEWISDKTAPDIFKMLAPKHKKRDQGDAFIRWRVQVPGDPVSAIWKDRQVRASWIGFDASQKTNLGLCMVRAWREVACNTSQTTRA